MADFVMPSLGAAMEAGKLVEWRDYAARRDRLTIRWEDGARLPFLGRDLTMRLDPSHRGPPNARAPPPRRW